VSWSKKITANSRLRFGFNKNGKNIVKFMAIGYGFVDYIQQNQQML
jgi:hypothetical protein